jgi:GNAT superfamily N-acetyltransferase
MQINSHHRRRRETAIDQYGGFAMARATSKNRSAKRSRKPAPKAAKRAVARKKAPARKAATRAAKLRRPAKATQGRAATRARKPAGTKPAPTAVPAIDSSVLRWTDALRDGTHVIIRAIGKRDAAIERRFIERLSPESRRMRFLGQLKTPSEDMIRQLTDIDYKRDMAFIALVHRDSETREIGVSRYSIAADGKSCECAVTVADDWHNKGLATLLMRHLIDVARSRGIRSMVSYDAMENSQMRQLAQFLGFERRTDPEDAHMVIHRLTL